MLTNAVRYADAGQHRLADVLDAARLLRERAEAGLVRRGLDRDPRARQRLEEELAVIRTLT